MSGLKKGSRNVLARAAEKKKKFFAKKIDTVQRAEMSVKRTLGSIGVLTKPQWRLLRPNKSKAAQEKWLSN